MLKAVLPEPVGVGVYCRSRFFHLVLVTASDNKGLQTYIENCHIYTKFTMQDSNVQVSFQKKIAFSPFLSQSFYAMAGFKNVHLPK